MLESEGKSEGATSDKSAPPATEELELLFPEFEFHHLLGRGGMGAVYLARQPQVDRLVAIKILSTHLPSDPRFAERFRREATVLANLNHANIVTLHDFGEREEYYYFVMEHVDGTDLARRLTKEHLSVEDVLKLAPQICDALDYSHAKGVVHRDIKPANILINERGIVKIADFGLAKLKEPQNIQLTQTDTAVGTPRYMAPEQLESPTETDHRADLYALGVMLYEMLTGKVPSGHFDPPSSFANGLTAQADAAILKAMHSEPDQRFDSANALKETLLAALSSPNDRKSLGWKVILPPLLALVISGGIIWVTAFRPSTKESSPSESIRAAVQDTELARSYLAQRQERSAGQVLRYGFNGTPLTKAPANQKAVVDLAVSGSDEEFGFMLLADGTVKPWGANRYGQTNVPTALRNVVAVTAGNGPRAAHALALQSDGKVVAWGDDTYQQSSVPADLTSVVSIAAGQYHSLALASDGSVRVWGHAVDGITAVPEDLDNVRKISAGARFSLALTSRGTVVTWGSNEDGILEVPELREKVVDIAAGASHAIALLDDGSLITWGKTVRLPTSTAFTRLFAQGHGGIKVNGEAMLWGIGQAFQPAKFPQKIAELAVSPQALTLLAPHE